MNQPSSNNTDPALITQEWVGHHSDDGETTDAIRTVMWDERGRIIQIADKPCTWDDVMKFREEFRSKHEQA